MAGNVVPLETTTVNPPPDPSDELQSLSLVIPPFPPRSPSLPPVEYPLKVLPKDMTLEAATAKKEAVLKLMDAFEE